MKNFFKKHKRILSTIVTVLILTLTIFAYWQYQSYKSYQLDQEKIRVDLVKVVDGDTAYFNNPNLGDLYVRFLCIDTPEMDTEYGPAAKEYTASLLEKANLIQLLCDPASSENDKYDRSLYYIFVDGELLQQLIVENGYGEVKYCDDSYMFYYQLMTAQNKAKADAKGIWQ